MSKHHHKSATSANTGPVPPTSTGETTIASSDKDQNTKAASLEEIRLRAYQKWEAAGKPNGDGFQFWLEAKQELMQGK